MDFESEALCVTSPRAYAIQAGALRENPTSGPDGMGVQPDVAYTIEARAEVQALCAYGFQDDATPKARKEGAFCLRREAGGEGACVMTPAAQVRRLTPTECERLQGFPDGYTRIPWRGKGADECPDGPRYKALGNSMAVPCMRWIGERILSSLLP
jgi:DNA (cytosine-5)-methyltransferase 1